jgi:tetratricopeptide (TPR) repeat protein
MIMRCVSNPFPLLLMVGILLCGGALPVAAETVIKLNAEQQLAYAQHLYSQGEYRRAIDEYKRFLYFFPHAKQYRHAFFQIGMAHYRLGAFPEAVQIFQDIMNEVFVSSEAPGDTVIDAWFRASDCYRQLKQYGVAVLQLQNLMQLSSDPVLMDRAHLQIAWIFIESGAWEQARFHLKQIRPQTIENGHLAGLIHQLEMLEKDQDTLLPRKNPVFSGLLSMLPGAGYVYCERYRDALISFMVNGGLMLAAWQAFEDDQTVLGTMLSFLGAGFYSGNIYGSITAAHKYNRAHRNHYINELKKHYVTRFDVGVLPDLRHRGGMLTFRWRF